MPNFIHEDDRNKKYLSQGNFDLLNRVSKSIVRASLGLSSSASITPL